jgi:hypothetical protein
VSNRGGARPASSLSGDGTPILHFDRNTWATSVGKHGATLIEQLDCLRSLSTGRHLWPDRDCDFDIKARVRQTAGKPSSRLGTKKVSHQMVESSPQRIRQLEELIQLDYEKLEVFERELIITNDVGTKFQVQQRIRNEILPSLRRYEKEYAEYLATTTPVEKIPEPEAQNFVTEILRAADSLDGKIRDPSGARLVSDLREKLARPDTASAKLKLTLPIIPLIASYEITLDTSGLMMSAWRSVKAMFANISANPT